MKQPLPILPVILLLLLIMPYLVLSQPLIPVVKKDRISNLQKKVTDSIGTSSKKSQSLIRIELETFAGFNTNESVPYWMRANRFGSTPLSGTSGGIIASISKSYDSKKRYKLFDWAAGAQARFNTGNHTEVLLIEGFVKARLGIFEFKGGRSKDIMGIVDSTLSLGSFSVSGNSLGIPKIQLAVTDYWRIPVWDGLLSFKGNFAYGWFGNTPIATYIGDFQRSNIPAVNSYFHQKSFYARLGKPSAKLNLIGGFNHQTMFGSEDKIFTNFDLTKFQSFYYAVIGKTWYDNNGANTKLGNQIGSIDLGATYDFNKLYLFVYRQQFYDVGALAHLANVRDGLTGISLKNKTIRSGEFYWKKILLENFYSKNQAGESWSKPTPSGDEAYYNNFMYLQGWSYRGMGIGNPLITPRHEARNGLRYKEDEYFINNRVIAFHLGMEASIGSLNFLTKLSYSQNYGTYGTSPLGTSRNKLRWPIPPPYFQKVNQFSGYLECNKVLQNNWQIGISTAIDSGKLLNDSFGLALNIRKSLNL